MFNGFVDDAGKFCWMEISFLELLEHDIALYVEIVHFGDKEGKGKASGLYRPKRHVEHLWTETGNHSDLYRLFAEYSGLT